MSEAARNWQQVARDLRAIVDTRFVIDDRETLRPYECDGLSVYREMPRLVVIPDSVEEVCAVMAYCHGSQIPVVVRGAGTSLCAGAMPHADGIVLSMAKFTRIIEIDPESRLARVECGVRNLAISEAAATPRALLCAGPVFANCLHDRRQCRGKLGGRALPQIRHDRAQRAAGHAGLGRG